MSEKRFTAEQLKNAELWLLPEVEGRHSRQLKLGKIRFEGFSSRISSNQNTEHG